MKNFNKDGCMGLYDFVLDPNRILDEGDYNFVVTECEFTKFPGNKTIPPCIKVIVTLLVETGDGSEISVNTEFLLHKAFSWKIVGFFKAIFNHKDAHQIKMEWDRAVSARGRAHIRPRTYLTSKNEERTVNDVAYFLPFNERYFEPVPEFVVVDDEEEIPF